MGAIGLQCIFSNRIYTNGAVPRGYRPFVRNPDKHKEASSLQTLNHPL
jgi:hypothetical protein